MKTIYKFLPFAFCLSPASAHACAVCFGEGSQDLARGFYWGILLLLLLPLGLFCAIAGKIIRAVRKKKSSAAVAASFAGEV